MRILAGGANRGHGAPVNEDERVIRLDLPWIPDPGAPLPVTWQDDSRALVAYYTAASAPGGPLAIVEFEGTLCSMFGYPNDEALGGHPLFHLGLGYYGIFEVLGSSWLDELREQNLRVFPSATWWPNSPRSAWGPARHFVITFHDSTFECLARGIHGSFTAEQPAFMALSDLRRTELNPD